MATTKKSSSAEGVATSGDRYTRPFGRILFCSIVLALFGVAVESVNACTCRRGGTADGQYETYPFIAVLKLEGVGKTYKADPNRARYPDLGQSIVRVKKVYKGDLRVGEKLVFRQVPGSMCGWSFDKADVGKEFLFYMSSHDAPHKKPVRSPIWSESICSGSGELAETFDDIAYLDKHEKVKGKSRVAGMIGKYVSNSFVGVAGRRLLIKGGGKEVDVISGDNGVFETYDLPPGKYTLTAQEVEGPDVIYGKSSVNFELKVGQHFEHYFFLASKAEIGSAIFLGGEGFVNPFLACTSAAR